MSTNAESALMKSMPVLRYLTTLLCRLGMPLLAALFLVVATPVMAAGPGSFVVNDFNTDLHDKTPGDGVCADINGKCSLRAAIEEGNALAGATAATPHSITFVVPQVNVINGSLPTMMAPFLVTGPTIINGTGNAFAHGCISVSDSGTSALGYGNGATGSTITLLSIGNCSGDGISANGHDYNFVGNFIGVDPTGLIKTPNAGHGISLSASHVYNNVDSSGLDALFQAFPQLPVQQSDISTFANNLATTLISLNPDKIRGNVISGNTLNGIELFSQNLAAVIISNNMIGTDITGNVAIANGGAGIHLTGSTFGNLIGPNNTISGNLGDGIRVESGTVYLPNFIMGNRIGLASTLSSQHIGNGANGIFIDTKPDGSVTNKNPSGMSLLIGPANEISDNLGGSNSTDPDTMGSDYAGIMITGTSNAVKVIGNTIGMAEIPAGTQQNSRNYGNHGDGIIVTSSGNAIGGAAASSSNTIAGNTRHGIVVRLSNTTSTSILGNVIGTYPAFPNNMTLGNGFDGIHIDGASSTTTGGPGASDFNVIAANGRNGIALRNGGSANGWGNLSHRNQIYGNAKGNQAAQPVALPPGVGVSIDLDHSVNAADGPHSEFPSNYTNLDQAPPVICTGAGGEPAACAGFTAPVSNGGNTTLDWTITTHGPASFRMEFFTINAVDSNAANSITFLGEQLISTNILTGLPNDSAVCSAGRCSASIPGASGGAYVVMTASDITPLTNQPGGGSDWKSNLTCFIGDLGIILSACGVNDTSEYSNVASIPQSAATPITTAATNVTATAATLNGTVSANGASTVVTFEFGTTNAYGGAGSPLTAMQSPLGGSSVNAPVSVSLAGLTCNTLYHFRVDANNGVGSTINGVDLMFTTAMCAAVAPTATTSAASNITKTTATLAGIVSANGATTTVTFEYGATNAYGGAGSPLTAIENPLSSGSTNAAVSVALPGLTCNTLYHFRVDANNGVGGTINGADQTFTTAACAAAAPTATTVAASGVTATTATVNATVSANGATVAVTFEYGPTVAYGGLGSPLVAAQSPLTSGSANAPVSVALSGLTCNTLYHFRVDANNGVGGTINGADLTFTTAGCGPIATTAAATAVTATTVTLNGTVTANGASTAVTFEYGMTNAYGGVGSPLTATQNPLAGNANNVVVLVPLAGLICNTLYHFRVNANNGVGGTVNGSDLTFTTAVCAAVAPTATSGAATNLMPTSATLNGVVSANGSTTAVTFEYGTTATYGGVGSPLTATQSPLSSGASNAAVSVPLAGLTCNTLYHFKVDANNGIGSTINGNDLTFMTSACPVAAPAATTGAASAVTAATAALNGTVGANGAATTVTFEYGTSNAYSGAGSPQPATQSPLGSSTSNTAVSVPLAGLTCNTTYHFRVDANNGVGGTINGSDLTFTTSACVPMAATAAANGISMTAATLNGMVSANGAATTVTFEYGTTATYGGVGSPLPAAQSPLAGNASNVAVSVPLAGLICNTLYHFRVAANNGVSGTINGADMTFTTASCAAVAPTATTSAATAVATTSATLNGIVTANGASATVTFEYGTTAAYGAAGSPLTAPQSPLASNAINVAVSVPSVGLTCNTLYHFRIGVNNGLGGTINGADMTFTTASCSPTVTTFSGTTVTNTGIATAVLSGGGPTCSFGTAALVGPSVALPAGVTFPDGLFQFSAINCVGTVTITATFPTAFAPSEQYWKYGPTPGPVAAHWYTLGGANSLVLAGNTATFTIADGGLGDDDLASNGTIIDQGGPGVGATQPGSVSPIPTLSEWAGWLLSGLLALAGIANLKRRLRSMR